MLVSRFVRTILLVAAPGAITASSASPMSDPEDAINADGLDKVKVRNTDSVYARPGPTLVRHARVAIDPVRVAFPEDREPQGAGSRTKRATDGLDRIRTDVGTVVGEQFSRELAQASCIAVASTLPDVRRVRARIRDLVVSAPAAMEPGRAGTHTMSAGEMTLVMELADSDAGAEPVRVCDRGRLATAVRPGGRAA